MQLNDTDRLHLESMESKLTMVRDRVRGVAKKWYPGFYLYGRGGGSKTWTCQQTLKESGVPFREVNTHLSGPGLFSLLKENPTHIIVIDDAEGIFSNRDVFGILRQALQTHGERVVTWNVKGGGSVTFSGGIVMVGNRPLDNRRPELQAIGTRCRPLLFEPTDEEMAAKMRAIARDGYLHNGHRLPSEECLEVAQAVIERFAMLRRCPDLRLLIHGFCYRLQWKCGDAETHWMDMIEAAMEEDRPVTAPKRRSDRVASEREIALSISHLPRVERVKEWQQRTSELYGEPKSEDAYYRRLRLYSEKVQNCET